MTSVARNAHSKGRALAFFAGDRDRAAVELDDMLDDREA
jgi:hypothetical protein